MKFLSGLLYGNWLIAFAAGILTGGVSVFFSAETALFNSLLIGTGTLFMYNFQRTLSPPPIKPHPTERSEWSILHQPLFKILSIFTLLILAVASFFWIHTLAAYLVLISAVFLGLIYAAKNPFTGKPLREIPYVKIHVIVVVWLLCCFVFPLKNSNNLMPQPFVFIGLNYLFFLAITIPFDIRDVLNDFKTQKTIPQVIGVSNAKKLAAGLLITFYISIVSLFPEFKSNFWLLGAVLYQLICLVFVKKDAKDALFSGFIDGGIILLGLAYYFSA